VAGFLGLLAACGAYDLSRNKNFSPFVAKTYFFGNGLFTWLLSPVNTLLDLLALPYRNKGVYNLEDLPAGYRNEIKKLIHTAHAEKVVERLEAVSTGNARTMVFWKWYGANVDAVVDIPAFHESYQYVRTIGVSVFNKRQSTSRHFGPLRATLRVLYNINDIQDESAYIEVGDITSRWRDNKLFIFDDTLMHKSVNETDQIRYCLFVDILRPSVWSTPFSVAVGCVRYFLRGVNSIFYKHWNVLGK